MGARRRNSKSFRRDREWGSPRYDPTGSGDRVKDQIIASHEEALAIIVSSGVRQLSRDAAVEVRAALSQTHRGGPGAMVIIAFRGDPLRFAVVMDKNKRGRWGFVYGGQDPEDDDIAAAASRECREEIHLQTELSEDHILGKLVLQDDAHPEGQHTITIFFQMMDDVPIAPGDEQVRAEKFAAEDIRELISHKKFLKSHAEAWKIVEELLG